MANILRPEFFRRAINRFIEQQPIHVQAWIMVSGDGLLTAPSYAFSYSYLGALADTGKEVFRDFQSRGAGSVSMKNVVVTLPYQAGKPIPRRGDELRLYWQNGTLFGRVRTNGVYERRNDSVGVSSNTTWAIECHCEILEG